MTQHGGTQTTPHTAEAGTVIARRDLDFVRIDIVKAVGGYAVIVWTGTAKTEGWCDNYTTLDTARNAANHARNAFRLYGTAQAIADRRNLLAIQRGPIADRLDRSRSAEARAAYTAQIEAIDTEMAQLEDLTTARRRVELAAHFAEAA